MQRYHKYWPSLLNPVGIKIILLLILYLMFVRIFVNTRKIVPVFGFYLLKMRCFRVENV